MTTPTGRRRLLGAVALCGLGLAGRARSQGATDDPSHAQGRLSTEALAITTSDGKRHEFSVEVALTPRQQQVGLMYRTSIEAGGGMLFVWARPQASQMWMEHCPVSEDMVFIGTDGVISSIAENTVPESLALISSGGLVAATLELQGGLTEKLGINVGDKVDCKALSLEHDRIVPAR